MPKHFTRRTTLQASLALGAGAALPGCATTPPVNAADAAFAKLSADWIDAFPALSPGTATALGDHRFDAQLDQVTPGARAASKALRDRVRARLATIDRAALSRDNQVDASILANALDRAAFAEETDETWAWDPLTHNEIAGGALYALMARDFAPLPQRLNAAAARLEQLPRLLSETRAALQPERVPAIHAETYGRQNPGLAGIIDGQIVAQAGALGLNDRARLFAAAERAKAAVTEHQTWIETVLKPQAKGNFRLGATRYAQKLTTALHSTMSPTDLKSAAEQRMAEVRAEMADIARGVLGARAPSDPQAAIQLALEKTYADRPNRDKVIATAESTLAEATAFLRARDLITLPDAPVRIIVMPEFQQGVAVAYCDSPGPLDKHLETFYAVSPIPADWTDAQTQSFLSEYNTRSIHELTVHEAMPGHYVQIWHSNKHPSLLRAVFGSGPFIEGWACYAQDMMIEAGYGGDDPLRRLINLKWALRVISNAILDQKVHVEGVQQAEAMQLMTRDAFQTEREAAGKWTRARVSSAQLPTYFVGWTEHWALRREAQARAGASFSLKAYHDQVLSFGSPPVRFARALMLDAEIA